MNSIFHCANLRDFTVNQVEFVDLVLTYVLDSVAHFYGPVLEDLDLLYLLGAYAELIDVLLEELIKYAGIRYAILLFPCFFA